MKTETKTQEQNLQVINSKEEIVTSLVLNGDLSKMNQEQKVNYYNMFCDSLGLNPVTQPFEIIKFNGKEKLYATKDATEQLRKINKVSIIESITTIDGNICITKVKVQDGTGRYDMATGVTVLPSDPIGKANGIMKAETKAKRRATLSICGLGILDESETDTIGKYETTPITNIETVSDNGNGKPKETEQKQEAKFFNELRDRIRTILGGRMSIKQAIDKLNELTGKSYVKFPNDEQECQMLLNTILMGGNGNGKN